MRSVRCGAATSRPTSSKAGPVLKGGPVLRQGLPVAEPVGRIKGFERLLWVSSVCPVNGRDLDGKRPLYESVTMPGGLSARSTLATLSNAADQTGNAGNCLLPGVL